jgi:DNA-binding FadR family transcriptional regulator
MLVYYLNNHFMQIKPVRKKLSDEVLTRIEELIRDEVWAVDSYLPSERDLMEMFGVGRPSIREALYALERMGLLRINTGERPKVTRPTPQNMLTSLTATARLLMDQPHGVMHFEQARLFLEVGVARHVAEFATPAQIGAVSRALEANEVTIPRSRAFAMSDVVFHRVLTESTGNPIFLAMHEALVEWLIAQRQLPTDPEVGNRRAFNDHVALFEAVEQRDPERAGQVMRLHLEHAWSRFGTVQALSKPREET